MRIFLIILLMLTLNACKEPKMSIVELGKQLYHDPILSKNKTQSCAQCHNPEHGFIDNRDNGVAGAVSLGDDGKSLGSRNTPTASYAMISPDFYFNKKTKEWMGGQFHDGRAKDLQAQAGAPPLNPSEMGMKDKQSVIERLKQHPDYAKQFKSIFGKDIFNDADKAYDAMTLSIAKFEQTDEFAPFDSKYDRYLRGEYELTDLEDLGRSLFFSNNNTNCSSCHQLKRISEREGETFSNYEYHNIGTPAREQSIIDYGLLANPQVTDRKQDGKFKVPTLRNIAVTGPYMHNGVFRELTTVIEFYDKYLNPSRTHNPETQKPWKQAEVQETVNMNRLRKGKKLSDRKIKAIVAFLNTLTDRRYEHLISK